MVCLCSDSTGDRKGADSVMKRMTSHVNNIQAIDIFEFGFMVFNATFNNISAILSRISFISISNKIVNITFT